MASLKHTSYLSKNKNGEPTLSSKIASSPYKTSHHSLKHSYKHNSNTEQRHVRKPTSQVKKVKHAYGRRRIGMQYSLQSKDSLLDVTACLQGKRNEVMKLWQKTIPKGDPAFLAKIEGANRLALEAAQEVEKLRTTIQELQRKEDGLSDSDCVQLEEMRVKVLEKVKQFEEADNLLQEIISQSQSKASVVGATSKISQTESNTGGTYTVKRSESTISTPQLPSHSQSHQDAPILAKKSHSSHEIVGAGGRGTSDFIIIKDKSDLFSEESECDNDIFNKNDNKLEFHENGAMRDLIALYPGNSLVGEPALNPLDNLNRMKELSKRNQDCLPVEEMIELTKKHDDFQKGKINQNKRPTHHYHQHHPKKKTEGTKEKTEHEKLWDSFLSPENSDDDIYKEKISTLRRQLMDTEHEVEELKSEIERIESDANFRVQMLQNSVRDNFERLRIIPDYLQMVDQKLNETVQHKTNLQQAIDNKDVIINELKDENHNLERETNKIREQLRKAENGNDFLSFKNTELEKSNTDLRKQVEDLTKQIGEMTCQLQAQKVESKSSRPTRHESWETHKLKLQCADLKDQLTQSKKIILTLRKSKTKMIYSLNRRVDELMDALQKSHDQKRILGDQIHNYKKSFNQLFSADLATQQQQQRKKKYSRERHHKTSNTAKSQPVEVQEPLIQPTVTWQTGFGIKLDDLLRAPSSGTKLNAPSASIEDFSNIKLCFQ